jgi:hypothetical protein
VGVSAGFEEPVAFAQRHLRRLGNHQHRLSAWLSPTGLDEAQMAR